MNVNTLRRRWSSSHALSFHCLAHAGNARIRGDETEARGWEEASIIASARATLAHCALMRAHGLVSKAV